MTSKKIDVREIPIDALVEDPSNPNRMEPNDYAMLRAAIGRVGFLQPILVRADGAQFRIVDGHHRARAAKEVGLERVTAVIWDGTEEMRRALQIGMNRMRGELDLGIVAQELAALADLGWNADDLVVTGFTGSELDALLEAARQTDEDIMDEGVGKLRLDPEENDEEVRAFTLELSFASAEELKAARRALKKAAKQGEQLADGLLRIIGEKE